MANEIATDLIVKAIAEGFDKVSKEIGGIGKASDEAGKKVEKTSRVMQQFDRVLGDLARGALQAAGRAMLDFVKGSVDLASSASETTSLLENSLGPAAEGFSQQIEEMAAATNRSAFELEAGASTIVAMTKSMGLGQQAAADYSATMAQVATDLGSFFNKETEDVFLDIQGALAGSSETLQKYGIDVRETQLKNKAFEMGLISQGEVLDRVTRAQVIQSEILRQAADAMGDAERTADSYSNTQRGVEAAVLDLQVVIGEGLMPALLALATEALPAVTEAAKIMSDVMADAQPTLTSFGKMIGEVFSFSAEIIRIKQLNDQIKESTGGFLSWGAAIEPIVRGMAGFKGGAVDTTKQLELMELALDAVEKGYVSNTDELVNYLRAQQRNTAVAEAMNEAYGDTVEVQEEVAEATEEVIRMTAEQTRAMTRAEQQNQTYEVSAEQVKEVEQARADAHEEAAEAALEAAEALKELEQRTAGYFNAAIQAQESGEGLAAIFEEVTTQSVFVSNATKQQADDLKDLQSQYDDAAETIREYEAGVKGATLTDEERNEKIEEQRELMGALEPYIASLIDLGGEYITVTGDAADRQGILNQALYDAALASGASASELAILGVALGLFTQEQAEAALKAAALQVEIDRLGQLIAGGMGIDTALELLDQFQERLGRRYEVNLSVQAALDALNELQNSADALLAKLAGAGGPEPEGGAAPAGGGGNSGGGGGYDPGGSPAGGNLPGPGGATGLHMIVPSGYPNDTFPIRASSYEEVIIRTPGQQSASANGGGVIVNIDHIEIPIHAAAGMDTEQLAQEVIRELGAELKSRINSRALGSRF
jgi:hypothetical protein